MPQRPPLGIILLWVVLVCRPAAAQVLTGSLSGTVRDESGGVLSGAAVRASSPAAITGSVVVTTDERGVFRLPALAPGAYSLEIQLAGFAGYREAGIQVDVESTIERSVTLKIAGIAESISVEGGSTIDTGRTGLSSRFDLQELQAIPVRRFSMFDFIKAAPGVSPTSPSSGTDPSVSVFGSGGNESLYLLDGTNFTCPCSGGPQPQPDVDVIQEVHVDSVGASAEFGNIQGAVFNVVTKQGSNVFAPDFSYYGQAQGLTSQPVELPCSRCSEPNTAYTRVRYRDLTTHLGGPLIPDRVWFFGGYQYLRDSDSQPGTDPLFPRVSEYDKGFAKVTWQITPRLKWMSSLHNERWVTPQRPTLVQPFETTLRMSGTRPTTTFGQLTAALSSNTLVDARVSRFSAPSVNDPSMGDRTTPNHVDLATGVQSGGPQGFGAGSLSRTTAAASISHYRRFFASTHELKAGAQIEQGANSGWTAFPGGVVTYTDNAGQPVQATLRQPATSGGEFHDVGLYAMDAIRFADRVTVSLGLRFDHDRAVSQDLPGHDAFGNEVGTISGLGTLYSWNVVSPRVGLTVRLTDDGRTMLRASYGRFHQGILTGELNPVHPGMTPITTAGFDSATGRYSRIISVVDPTINVRLDSEMRSPRTDQIGIGVDRELAKHTSLTISYVRKNGSDFIGWTDTGGIYRPDARTLADGRIVPVFVLTNGTAARRFLLTNPPDYFLRYNGLTTALEKRWSGGWQVLASYTLSKTEGLESSSGSAAGLGQFSSTFGNAVTFGRDPNTLANATGLLPNDRTHVFRVMGSAAIPRTGFVLAANLQSMTGSPWAATSQISLPQGLTRVLLETAGTRRLSSQTLLDLRLSHVFDLPHNARVELLLDVLNALNQKSEERLADDNYFSQNFAKPSVFMDPRRAMLGARLTF
jgi:carboxypeptidase family protein/TonB-dependent receptor-like protein